MQVEQRQWTPLGGWQAPTGSRCEEAQVVFAFGAPRRLEDASLRAELTACWPEAHIVGCSTAGEIAGTRVCDDSLVATALRFERAWVAAVEVALADATDSVAAGRALAAQLDPRELRHVFVLSDGLHVNGSDLASSLASALPRHVAVTGGLSGDGPRFERTLVGLDSAPRQRRVVAIGFTVRRCGSASARSAAGTRSAPSA